MCTLTSIIRSSSLAAVLFTPLLAATFGNTTPFETQTLHGANYVLGVEVVIPQPIRLQSFGLMYGESSPLSANGIFGLYSSDSGTGFPFQLMAVTNPVALNAIQTYDNIPFTTTPVIAPGTYWMMGLYDSVATPRVSVASPIPHLVYWANSYASGMPSTASPLAVDDFGTNFNYWVNGQTVPEPGTFGTLGLAASALLLAARRRRTQ